VIAEARERAAGPLRGWQRDLAVGGSRLRALRSHDSIATRRSWPPAMSLTNRRSAKPGAAYGTTVKTTDILLGNSTSCPPRHAVGATVKTCRRRRPQTELVPCSSLVRTSIACSQLRKTDVDAAPTALSAIIILLSIILGSLGYQSIDRTFLDLLKIAEDIVTRASAQAIRLSEMVATTTVSLHTPLNASPQSLLVLVDAGEADAQPSAHIIESQDRTSDLKIVFRLLHPGAGETTVNVALYDLLTMIPVVKLETTVPAVKQHSWLTIAIATFETLRRQPALVAAAALAGLTSLISLLLALIK
jgi:hypothetical protein